MNQGRYREAEDAFCGALRLDPDLAAAHNNLGYLLMQIERYDAAIASLNRALELDPDFTYARNNLREAESLQRASRPTYRDDRANVPNDPISKLRRSVVRIDNNGFIGTGWVLSRSGDTVTIVTNRHVLTRDSTANGPRLSDNIQVDWFSEPPAGTDYRRQPARILHHNADPDLAVLEVSDAPEDIHPLTLKFEPPDLTTELLAIGHPNIGDPWTVIPGTLTNRSREHLQIAAPVSYGNSGGPVLDDRDRVVGMMVSFRADGSSSNAFALAYPLERLRSKLRGWGLL